jgi:Protein of unknown function (DUF3106)
MSAVTDRIQLASSTTQQLQSRNRPAVRNAIEALRAMPPDARKRQLNSDRYSDFSPEERRLLNDYQEEVNWGIRPQAQIY